MKDRNNLEQQLADKLGNRSIAPSNQAWDRIVRNREQGRDKKNKKRIYLYYAASIAVVMLFGGYFFTWDKNVEIQPQIVTSGSVDKTENVNEPAIASPSVVPPEHTKVVVVYKEREQQPNRTAPLKEEVKIIAEPFKNVTVKESLPEINAVALQQPKVFSKDELYDAEVDNLLKDAVKNIAADKQFKNRTNDAALLKEVEGEMDEYYREKAMSIFSLKNKKIRFAVKN